MSGLTERGRGVVVASSVGTGVNASSEAKGEEDAAQILVVDRSQMSSGQVKAAMGGEDAMKKDAGMKQKGMKKTPEQLEILEAAFSKTEYLDESLRFSLSQKTGLTEHQVVVWFAHRRRKERKLAIMGPSSGLLRTNDHALMAEESESEGYDDINESYLDDADRQKYKEMKMILDAAAASMGTELREDGPPLGYYFDDLPSPSKKNKKAVEESRLQQLTAIGQQEFMRLEATFRKEQERLLREKAKCDDRLARERAREVIRLEAEKRRQMARLLKEQKKEEERRAREQAKLALMQQREERRLEQIREKELKREAKLKEREEKKKERERLKALSRREKEALRTRSIGGVLTKDDLEVEWDALIKDYKEKNHISLDLEIKEGSEPPDGAPPLPTRPDFPPSSVQIKALGPVGYEADDYFCGKVISAWSFLRTFSSVFALHEFTVDDLMESLALGKSSKLNAQLHVALLRLIQADAEEGRATGLGALKPDEICPSTIFTGAQLLEEAWAWGFDVDYWRAHLNEVTWPEVCRRVCIAAGLGRRRPKQRKQEKARAGEVGDDLVISRETGKLELKLPDRLSESSVKGAAWMVLKDAGYEGFRVEEIASRIQKMGLRDLRTSRTPEASGTNFQYNDHFILSPHSNEMLKSSNQPWFLCSCWGYGPGCDL